MIRRLVILSARLAFGVALLSSVPASAQTAAPPVADARRISTAPRIDGRLDDAAWQTVLPITGFRQREPQAGADASEPTTVRIGYDPIWVGGYPSR